MHPLDYRLYQMIARRRFPPHPVPAPFQGKYPTKMVVWEMGGESAWPRKGYFGAPNKGVLEKWIRRVFEAPRQSSFILAEVDRRNLIAQIVLLSQQGRNDITPETLLEKIPLDHSQWLWRVYHPWKLQMIFHWLKTKWEVRSLATGLGPMKFYVDREKLREGNLWQKEYRAEFGSNEIYERELAREQPVLGVPEPVVRVEAGNPNMDIRNPRNPYIDWDGLQRARAGFQRLRQEQEQQIWQTTQPAVPQQQQRAATPLQRLANLNPEPIFWADPPEEGETP